MILVADVQRALLQLLELAFRVGGDGVRVGGDGVVTDQESGDELLHVFVRDTLDHGAQVIAEGLQVVSGPDVGHEGEEAFLASTASRSPTTSPMNRMSMVVSEVARANRYISQKWRPPILLRSVNWVSWATDSGSWRSWRRFRRPCRFWERRSSFRNPMASAISKKLWIDGTLEGYFAVVVVGESQDVAAEGEVEVGVGGVVVWLCGICGLR